MSDSKIDCYILPSLPLPVLLPTDCVADIVKDPVLEAFAQAPAEWMKGHVNWQNQRLPVMSYASLVSRKKVDVSNNKQSLVVLNAIPDAVRKAYSALLCDGVVEKVTVDKDVVFADLPKDIDKRYVEAVVQIEKKDFIIPRLTSLGVAFTYI